VSGYTKLWRFIIRLYASLLGVFGVFLVIISIYISLPDSTNESGLINFSLVTIPFALIYVWAGYKAARQITPGTIRLLTVVTLLLLINKAGDLNNYLFNKFVEQDTINMSIAYALALPEMFILYFVIVKILHRLVFGEITTVTTPNNTPQPTPKNGAAGL
jgi:hypothetical protein